MTGGILSGRSIAEAVEVGRIRIDPYDPQLLNPASYDLRLGDTVAVYPAVVDVPTHVVAGSALTKTAGRLDSREPNAIQTFKIPSSGWWLLPGVGYLMHTVERVSTDCFVPVLDGKSSIGRLFITTHVTAGYGDPGFDGQYTLEVTATHRVRVYAGMRFCQIRFHTLVGSVDVYSSSGGHYTGDAAMGPVASRSWQQC